MSIPELPESIINLPAVEYVSRVSQALPEGNVLFKAQPGAGKSTGLPLGLLVQGNVKGEIIVLEPRRLAARAVAERLAWHLHEKVGERIGLRMRQDTRVSDKTELLVVTEGVLTRMIQDDPSLENVGLIIFDEFHERSLHADTGLAFSLEVQRDLRSDLRLLLMSATLDLDHHQEHLQIVSSFTCAVRQHPVAIVYLGDSSDALESSIVKAVLAAMDDHVGDILVFLPGVAEINRTHRKLSTHIDSTRATLHTLHSGVSRQAQQLATASASDQHRRVILSTSLAETSITIPGVTVVVDSGLERRGRVDTATGAQLLETVMASQASATQRAGRAGRTAPGVCYRLWSEAGHTRRAANWQPEILRADLAPLIIELNIWGAAQASDLPWLDAPPSALLSRAESLLMLLGLKNATGLTSIGRIAARIPVHPRIAAMLIWSVHWGMEITACEIAVRLEEKQKSATGIDIENITGVVLTHVLERRQAQLRTLLARLVPATDFPYSKRADRNLPSLAILLAQAFPDWIAKRRPGDAGRFQLACGAGVIIDSDDALAHSEWLVVAQLGGASRQARIFKAISLDVDELKRYCDDRFETRDVVDWDEKQQRVQAEQRLMLGQLVVYKKPNQEISDSDRTKGLLKGIMYESLDCLPWNEECRQWQARVLRMRDLPEGVSGSSWPDVSDESLLAECADWLAPYITRTGSIKGLQQLDLLSVLKYMLDYEQQLLLDKFLPLHYAVPSGSRIRLDYTVEGNPRLSVKLQEMFGYAENPHVAMGHVALKVELLSPARRAVQITEDLANFWENSYPAVKKDLAGRYPKHYWPDNPLEAQATNRAKPRRKK